MSVIVGSHDARVPGAVRRKLVMRAWLVLVIAAIACIVFIMPTTITGRRLIALYRQPIFLAISGLIIFQFVGVGLYAFMYPQNRRSIKNRLLVALFSLMLLPVLGFGMQADLTRVFGQTGIAVQQCFGPASASFRSSAIPQIACLQAWNTPYAVVERRKIAEFSQKECLKQEDEKISANVERAMAQFNAFDPKDKVLAAFRGNQIPLETADGQTYFANISTSCLDGAGYDRNSQFKVVVLVTFSAGSLVRDITVSSSNASSFTSTFAKNGVAESYRVDFENRRRLTALGQSLSGIFSSKTKTSSLGGDVTLSNLSLTCAGDACASEATLSGTVYNQSSTAIRQIEIAWGVSRDGVCDQSMTDRETISFAGNSLLGESEQRSFSVPVRLSGELSSLRSSSICGSIAQID